MTRGSGRQPETGRDNSADRIDGIVTLIATTALAVRGGGYLYDAWHLRSAVRLWDPGVPADDLGFRCAKTH